MSPEQVRGMPVDQRADLFIGYVAYEMLAGQVPFSGTASVLCKQAHELRRRFARGVNVSAPIASAIDHALAKDPDQRPPRAPLPRTGWLEPDEVFSTNRSAPPRATVSRAPARRPARLCGTGTVGRRRGYIDMRAGRIAVAVWWAEICPAVCCGCAPANSHDAASAALRYCARPHKRPARRPRRRLWRLRPRSERQAPPRRGYPDINAHTCQNIHACFYADIYALAYQNVYGHAHFAPRLPARDGAICRYLAVRQGQARLCRE
jgi:hypothetical protein